jgi:CRP/FNR family transcriptional regulator, cyclic AMP receptor protein
MIGGDASGCAGPRGAILNTRPGAPEPSLPVQMSSSPFEAVGPAPIAVPVLLPGTDAADVVAPLVDLLPELADGLTPALREQVRAWLAVRVWSLPRGDWPAHAVREDGLMGYLVLDGVLARCVGLGKAAYPELLGRGDLLRPWQAELDGRLGPVEVRWQVLEPCRVAVLDRRFARIVGRWPEIVDELLTRALSRAREMDFHMAIAQLPLLEARLLALLWHLADRWGEPVPGGVRLPIRLTHGLLAAMVLARRPSVSTTMTDLAQRGLLSRRDDGWVLHGKPPTELHKLSRRDGAHPLGA